MTLPHPISSPLPALDQSAEKLLQEFEDAWQTGTAELECFLPPQAAGAPADPARLDLLAEFIKIDLDYRWRRAAEKTGPGQLFEHYAKRYPELSAAGGLPVELIAEEYRVRRFWGHGVGRDEYAGRFPALADRLRAALDRVDAELANEISEENLEAPTIPLATAVACEPPLASVPALLNVFRQLPVISRAQLEVIRAEAGEGRFGNVQALVRRLVRDDWLTPYQANLLLQGRGSELFVGSYILLGRLGQGGTGQVFKARHQTLERVVALKVIRPELLIEPEIVARFYREIQIVSQLSHPHIVHAYDAGPTGSTHILAMEYVEGIDLGRLVKRSGPLPVTQACEFIRQAALGLQHAFECGLVHRDVKPGNLLVSMVPSAGSQPGIVKLIDLGLGRLQQTTADGGLTNSLTPRGAVMIGTPDFLAPEQAIDFHAADIRADIYGLGCTLYYLLTGQPPFPGGALAEKLVRHQLAVPPSLQHFRSDVPPALEAMLHRMLGKRPEDRFQTPGELAEVIEAGVQSAWSGSWAPESSPAAERESASGDTQILDWPTNIPRSAHAPPVRPAPVRRRRIVLLAGAAAAVVMLAFMLAQVYWSSPLPAKPHSSNFTIVAEKSWQDTHVDVMRGGSVTVRAEGRWRKEGPLPETDADGLAAPPRTRVVWLKAAPLALLGRIGAGDPFVLGSEQTIDADRAGRLFVQANDLDLDRLRGSLNVTIEGGAFSNAPASPPPPAAMQAAEVALKAFAERLSRLERRRTEVQDQIEQPTAWSPVEIIQLKARNGSTLANHSDGSILASGTNPATECYTISAETRLTTVTAIRLEMLTDTSLPRTGPGRAYHGNFVLSEFRLSAAPRNDPRPALSVPIARALADFSQGGWGPELAIDDKLETGWAVAPRMGEAHAAVFELRQPIRHPEGAVLTFTLDQLYPQHNLGRFRLSVTNRREPSSLEPPPEPIERVLALPTGKRTAAQSRLLVEFFDRELPQLEQRLGDDLFAFRRRFPGSAQAAQAARLGLRLPAPLDRLDPDTIPAEDRVGAPAELVAILGGDRNRNRAEVRAVAFHPDGRRLASAGKDRTVKLWDLSTGQETHTLAGHAEEVLFVSFTSDGLKLVSGSSDGVVKVWEAHRGDELRTIACRMSALGYALNADGRTLACAGADRSVQLWDVESSTEVPAATQLRDAPAFRPDGFLLAAGGVDDSLTLWSRPLRQVIGTVPGGGGRVLAQTFRPDGRVLATARADQTIQLWDLLTMQPLASLKSDDDTQALAFRPDGALLAALSAKGTVRLWDPSAGLELRSFRLAAFDSVRGLAFSPDGRHLATANGNGTIAILRLAPPGTPQP